MTSTENSVLEASNLNIFWGRIHPYPLKRLVPSALEIMSPRYKKPNYGPGRSSQQEVKTAAPNEKSGGSLWWPYAPRDTKTIGEVR